MNSQDFVAGFDKAGQIYVSNRWIMGLWAVVESSLPEF